MTYGIIKTQVIIPNDPVDGELTNNLLIKIVHENNNVMTTEEYTKK